MCQVWVVDIKVSELCITCVLGSMVSTAVRWYVSYVHCKSGFVCKLLIADCAWWYVAGSCLHPNAELSSHWLSPTLSVEILNRLTYSATPPAPSTQIGFPHIFKFQPRQYKKVSESLELRLNTEMPSAADDVHKKIVVYLWWLLLVISDQRYHLLWWETPLHVSWPEQVVASHVSPLATHTLHSTHLSWPQMIGVSEDSPVMTSLDNELISFSLHLISSDKHLSPSLPV